MNTEARSSIDNLLATLKESLAQPGRSLLPLLASMSRFAKYSLANQILIFAQRPDATCVMGYRAWNKAGYQVRKGEHGIAIYAPMLFANKRDTAAESDTDAAPRLGYRVAYVFDIAQVDAIAGTDAAPVTALTVDTGAHRHLEALKAFLVGHNVELEYKALAPGLLGYTDGRRITCGTGPGPRHARDRSRSGHLPPLRAARHRRHRGLRRIHPVLPRHARHARRVARADPRYGSTPQHRT